MSDPAHPGRTLFVSIPVADLECSKAFFAKLGFGFDPVFSDETAACMPIGEHAVVMLLTREKFAEFSKLPIADPATHALAQYSFSVSSARSMRSAPPRSRRATPKRTAPRTTAPCTYAASSTSTATAGRSCGWTRRRWSSDPRRSRPPHRTPRPRLDPNLTRSIRASS